MFLLCKPAYTEEEITSLQIFTNTHQVLLVVGGMDDLVNWGTLSSTEVGLQKSTAHTFSTQIATQFFLSTADTLSSPRLPLTLVAPDWTGGRWRAGSFLHQEQD